MNIKDAYIRLWNAVENGTLKDDFFSLREDFRNTIKSDTPQNEPAQDVIDYVLLHEKDDFNEQLGQNIEPLDDSVANEFKNRLEQYIENPDQDSDNFKWLALNGNNHVYCDALRAVYLPTEQALIHEGETDYTLNENNASAWVSVNDFSIYILRNGEDVSVEIFEKLKESECPIDSAFSTPPTLTPHIYKLYWTKEMLERIYGKKLSQSVLDKFEKRADKSCDYVHEVIEGVFHEILAKLVEDEGKETE